VEIRQLKYFMSVLRSGSMGVAAEENFVTQPAVSIQMRKLEEELGTKLLARKGRNIVPTPAGKLLARYGEEILGALARARNAIEEFKGCKTGILKIGAIDAAGIYVLPRMLRLFRRRFPGIDVNVEVSDSSRLAEDLSRDAIELAIVTLPVEGGDLEVVPVLRERMVLVAAPRHPLARMKRGVLKAVAETGLITYPSGSTTRRLIEEVFESTGLRLRAVMEVASPEAIKRLTEAGLGASVLPYPVAGSDIKRGLLKILPAGTVAFHRDLGLIVKKDGVLSPPARAFVDIIKEARSLGRRR